MEDTYTSRREEAVRFLSALHGDAVTDGAYVLTMLPGAGSLWLRPGTGVADVAHEAVQASLEPGVNIYGSCCLLDPDGAAKGGRGDAADVSVIAGIWADVDIAGPAHKSGTYPPDRDAALALLDRLELPPTLVVSSGWGLYPWWLLDRPYRLRDQGARTRGRQLVDVAQGAIAHHAATSGWTVDVTSDLARILRIPGTTNWKIADDPRPVEILADRWTGRRYSPDELSSTWGHHADWRGRRNGQAARQGADQYVPTGQRTYHVTSLAGVLRNWDAPEDVARVAALEFNRTRCDPPLADDKVAETVAGIYRRYQAGIRDPLAFLRDKTGSGEDIAWEPPVPLLAPVNLPAFPIDTLPLWLRDFAETTARWLQVPLDVMVGCLFAVIAGAAGRRTRIRIRDSWDQPLNGYFLGFLNTGERKTPLLAFMTAPIEAWEADMEVRTLAERMRAQGERDGLDGLIVKTKKKLMDEVDPVKRGELLDQIQTLYAEAQAVVVPPDPRFLMDDTTTAAMVKRLSESGYAMVYSDEGGALDNAAGRWSPDGKDDFQVYLRCYDGTLPLRVSRKDREYVIRQPLASVLLFVQPVVLEVLSGTRTARPKGFLGRFVLLAPPPMVGSREPNQPPPTTEQVDRYHRFVRWVLDQTWSSDGNTLLLLDDAGVAALADFEKQLEPSLHPETGERADQVDWEAKQVARLGRLVGWLHVMHSYREGHDPKIGTAVSADTVRAAIRADEFLSAHARAAFRLLGADPATLRALAIRRWYERRQLSRFSSRDVWQGVRGSQFFAATADVVEGLGVLADYGHVACLPAEPPRPGRPASPLWAVNPLSRNPSPKSPQPGGALRSGDYGDPFLENEMSPGDDRPSDDNRAVRR